MHRISLPRSVWLACLAHISLAVALCSLPLFEQLGYEFAWAQGLLAAITGLCIGHTTAAHPHAPWRTICTLSRNALLPCAAALCVSALNALRIRHCDVAGGLVFFFLLPCCSALYAAYLSHACQRLIPSQGRALRLCCTALLGLAPLLSIAWQLYAQPPIHIFDALWGYFPGSLYDEHIRLTPALYAWRAHTGLRMLLCIAVLLAMRYLPRRRHACGIAATALIAAVACNTYFQRTWPHNASRRDIEAHLAVHLKHENLRIFLPRDTPAAMQRAVLADHRFRYAQLSQRLELHDPIEIRSYVFANATDKAHWLGAQNTHFTKPWLGDIYIHTPSDAHPILAHEMVHVLAASWSSTWLRIPLQHHVLPQMGLVEGLATALSPPRGELDVHAQANEILTRSPHLKMQTLTGSAFWQYSPTRAYPLMGSLLQFIAATNGPQALRQLYSGNTLATLFGPAWPARQEAWRSMLQQHQPKKPPSAATQQTLQRRSIFVRPCPHALAKLRHEQARSCPSMALDIAQRINELTGNTPASQLTLARAHQTSGDTATAQRMRHAIIAEPAATAHTRIRALWDSLQHELLQPKPDFARGRTLLRTLQSLPLQEADQRRAWVLNHTLEQHPSRPTWLMTALLTQRSPADFLKQLAAQQRASPSATLNYLRGRTLYRSGQLDAAQQLLRQGPMHRFAPLERERWRLIAKIAWRQTDLATSAHAYKHLLEHAKLSSGAQKRAQDWLQRIEWTMQHTAAKTP